MPQTILARNARLLTSPLGFHLAVGGYLAVLFVLRVSLFPGASEDDAEALFYAQAFAFGYKPTQPPLYTWLALASEQLLGASVAAVEAVKFACLLALYLCLYWTARRVLENAASAALAALGVIGFYYLAWDAVLNYSHTVLAAAAIAATLLLLLNLERSGGRAAYLGLGAAVGAGLLAKHTYLLFLVPLAAAALSDPGLRARLVQRRIGLTLALAAALFLPHGLWLLAHPQALTRPAEWLPSAAGAGGVAVAGLLSVAGSALSFLLPLLLLLVVLAPRAWLPLARTAGGAGSRRWRRLFLVYLLAVAALTVALVLALGLSRIRTHWMIALIPFPIYAMLRIEAAGLGERVRERLAGLFAAGALAVVVGLGAVSVIAPRSCGKCALFIPYATLAAELRAAGFAGGPLAAVDHPVQLGGNLRRFFPGSPVWSSRFPDFRPPAADGDPRPCLILWNASRASGPAEAAALARRRLGVDIPADAAAGHVEAAIARSGGQTVRLAYLLLPACAAP